ncbi:MAG TPA: GDP-mannose 4,6-dehydratase [Lacunisphaera sp.]
MPTIKSRTTHSRSPRRALILGITGQDGSYLTELLLARGYDVHGVVRRASMFNRSRIEHLRAAAGGKSLTLHYSDLTDHTSLRRIIQKVAPREVYHLAGQSHVGLSFEIPEVTCQENATATLALLEILRDLDYPVKLYHAASSELFGAPDTAPQNESTPINPMNPYGCAKAFAAQMCRVYRRAYGLFAVNGIAYNHESPRRGENFVTRKITLGAARIKAGHQKEIVLGNLDAKRDWGWAPEYVEAMWRSLQAGTARDYIFATGRTCTVREFAAAAFAELDIELVFRGRGKAETARRKDTGAVVLRVDPRFYRPLESTALVGDARLAKKMLGWTASTVGTVVARRMARADFEAPMP